MKKWLCAMGICLMLAAPASAGVNVVATLPWIGSLAALLGGDGVTIKVLVKPGQDPHQIEAKPSMILAARTADILMYNGLELEIGYLPKIIESSANPHIQPGRPGHLDCSQFINPLEKTAAADRSLGDVHPLGNPHYHLSVQNILKVAQGMTKAFSSLDPGKASFYRANLAAFESRLKEERRQWDNISLTGKRFVAYHRFFEYLALGKGFLIVAYIEDRPGIPPSAGHLERLVENIKKTKPDGMLTTAYHGQKDVEALSRRTGIRSMVVPHDVGSGPGIHDWFSLMNAVLIMLK